MLQELLDRRDHQTLSTEHRPRPRATSHIHGLNPQPTTTLSIIRDLSRTTLATSSDTTR
jgi:hypothetical protein